MILLHPHTLNHIGTALATILLVATPALACPYDFASIPHYVKLHFGIPNTTITIIPVQDKVQDNWLFELFGINVDKSQIDYANATIVTTDDKGEAIVPLISVTKYNITIENASYMIYPNDNEYYFVLR